MSVNGRLTALENVTKLGTAAPGYIMAKDRADLERKLAEMPPGWRGKAYIGFGPDDWDKPDPPNVDITAIGGIDLDTDI